MFCVETSCLLVEVAWQVYYDPHRVNLSDFVAPGRQDLSYLGLELVVRIWPWGLWLLLCPRLRTTQRLKLTFTE